MLDIDQLNKCDLAISDIIEVNALDGDDRNAKDEKLIS